MLPRFSKYQMNPSQAEHYQAWARRFHKVVGGRVGVVSGDLYHLWHGGLDDRGYEERYAGLQRFGFDPFSDIEMDENGCWRWSAGKAELHEYLKAYFFSRKEDG